MMTLDYKLTEHGSGAPVNMVAQRYGAHMPHIRLDKDTDNGRWTGVSFEGVDNEVFKPATVGKLEGVITRVKPDGKYEVLITDAENAVFIYQKPLTAYETPKEFTDEKYFVNKAGDVVRGYVAVFLDRVDESVENFSGTPAVGAKITGVDADGKLVVGAGA